ncbi:transcriptional regulator, partial [Salmonella enterica subsp. enterica serovar Oslo]|nr:transcriptional regulator [Salmonella enterica subsp. enterica serovar Oslo]
PVVEFFFFVVLIRSGYFSVGESLELVMIIDFGFLVSFISFVALSNDTCINNATMFDVGFKTRIILRSREVILLADHSNFDTVE